MNPAYSPSPAKPPAWGLMLAGMFLLVLALRWHWISEYCSQLPFWDEWLDDAPLFRAFQAGTLSWEQLWAPFNGHRHLFQRLVKLACFWLNDRQWDSQMQATVNAFFGAAVPIALALAIGRPAGKAHYPAGTAIALLWLSPTLWYNATWAFQLAPVFLILCVLGGAALVFRGGRFWWIGILLLAAALWTQASGFLGAAAVALAIGAAAVKERAISRDRMGALIGGGLITVLGIVLQYGAGDAPEGFQAGSVPEFFWALAANFSWPLALEAPDGSIYYIGTLLWVPAPLLVGLWLMRRDLLEKLSLPRGTWELLLTLTIWGYGQLTLIALLRGANGRGPSWRHYELHAVGIALNVVALTLLWQAWPTRGRILLGAAAGYAGLLMAGIAMQWTLAIQVMGIQRAIHIVQNNTVREYLVTKDAARLRARPVFETPFMFLEQPDQVLDDAVIRDILPASVQLSEMQPSLREFMQVPGRGLGRFSSMQLPLLPREKMQFAEVWSSWPPISQPPEASRTTIWPDVAPPRFKWLYLSYITDPKAPGANGLGTISEYPPKSRETQHFNYLTSSEPSDWKPLILSRGPVTAGLADRPTWLAFTQPQGYGGLSRLAHRSRQAVPWIAGAGVILVSLGIGAARGWFIRPRNTAAAAPSVPVHSPQ